MTTTSQHLARIRWPSTWPASGDAVTPVLARDVAANNVNHRSDVSGQCRASFAPCALTGPGYLEAQSALTNQWFPLWRVAPFSVPLMPDATPYRLRVALAGSNGGGSTKARFAVVVGRVGSTRSLIGSGTSVVASDQVWRSAETTSSTAAYLSGASQGDEAYDRTVAMSARVASRAVETFTTLDGVAGSAVLGLACMVELVVYAWHESAGSPARLHAFSAYEVP